MPLTKEQKHYSPKEWSSYVDREIPSRLREEMSAHLQGCEECAALARSYEAVQRGAETLAQQAGPPPARLKPRLLAVGIALVKKQKSQRLWMLIGIATVIVIFLGLSWFALHKHPPTVVFAQAVAKNTVSLTLDHVQITKLFVYPPSLDYEMTIDNQTDHPVTITRVMVSDPLADTQRPVDPPYRIDPHLKVQWRFQRLVREDAVLAAGRYRIALITGDGSLTAEKVVSSSGNP